MKKKCLILSAIVLSCMYSAQVNANTSNGPKDNSSIHKLSAAKKSNEVAIGLKKVDEMKGPVYFDEIISFSPEGEELSIEELLSLLDSNEYASTFYQNEKGEIKVNVLRKLSQDEKPQVSDNSKDNFLKKLEGPKKLAKPFKAVDLANTTYTLENLKGKVIVINFWFIGCQPCEKEMPELNHLVDKYSGKDVVFLGLTFSDKAALTKFLSKKEFKYNIVPQANNIINQYNVFAYQLNLLLIKNRKLHCLLLFKRQIF
ncbi:TlpA disulfide reductase family protein [Chryseobacterium sp. MA9]|uniref:TlpA family protein disulfide reductase n=1 Tax=Chryseobacterium sp. MA9 TaxID=2966625 RepID=UPI0021057A01|nr:TlpA disulfide reductase family protein [Chryseobacterium sp. MA9]UTX48904.1 TlpA family protein disulfide reductase [Chryseobacterium sp. MA9]